MKTSLSSTKIILWCMLLSLAACSSPQMYVNEPLAQQSTPLDVSGRQGWLVNQRIQFGRYQTEKVTRNWTKSYSWDVFLAKLQGTEDKYQFTLFDGQGGAYTVHAANHIRGAYLPIDRFLGENASPALQELTSFTLQTQDLFAASLYNNERQEAWHLMLMNRDDTRKNGKYAGLLTHEAQESILVLPVRKLQNERTLGREILGYEFRQGNKPLAAVEVMNNGRVWIDPSLDENQQLVLATASATLLLQQALELPEEEL